ncbi:MAG: serine hydrolase [Desulfitobacterium hafniense]|nr:serine hydrolase [Desulfitobacterium hafniense]
MRRLPKAYLGVLILIFLFIIFVIRPSNLSAEPEDISQNDVTKLPRSIGQENLYSDQLSYLMINTETKQTLASLNQDQKRAPASTTKLLTGLVILKVLKPEDRVKVGNEVIVDGSGIGLRPGDEITVQELLKAMYIVSANDAAAALAVKASGSLEAFSDSMNKMAKSLGCTNSNFTTPHGLPALDQYTNAKDMTKIALAFIQNKDLMKYVKKKKATIQWKNANGGSRSVAVTNTNQLLNVYPGDIGLKTGTTQEAGQCLITYVEKPDGSILLALLGSKQRYKDTVELLDDGYAMLRADMAAKNLLMDPRTLVKSTGFFAP